MSPVRMLAIFLAAALLIPIAAVAQDQEQQNDVIEWVLVAAEDEDFNFFFYLEGNPDERNPTLTAEVGQTIRVTLRNEGAMAHDLNFAAPINAATELLEPGQNETIEFTIPAEAENTSIRYYCAPHEALGMEGALVVGVPEENGGNGGDDQNGDQNGNGDDQASDTREDETPGAGAILVALGVLGAALLARRR